MKKVALLIGTRPEAIKMAPLVRAFENVGDVDLSICMTGQHEHMADQVLRTFSIVPTARLTPPPKGGSLAESAAHLLATVGVYLNHERPQLVLAEGDTTTVLASALASFYAHIPFGHVEAGLRTGNLDAPWPEEANRVLTARISSLHFAPTRRAGEALRAEGIPASAIYEVGNTVVDALLASLPIADANASLIMKDLPDAITKTEHKVVLITGHRRENLDGGLASVCRAIRTLSGRFRDVEFIYPVHLNPRVQKAVHEELGASTNQNIHLIAPLDYLGFVWLMRRSNLIITDSGGIQEEAPTLGKPLLITRSVTERPEGVIAGCARLVGTDSDEIVDACSELLTNPKAYEAMAHVANPYGDGRAAERIVETCRAFLHGE